MANSQLYDKSFKLPPDVLKYIQVSLNRYPDENGIKRAKFLLKNGCVTYQTLKRLKNFFDNYTNNENKTQYELAGGDLMRNFVERTLNSNRNAVETSKEIKRDMNVDLNLGIKAQQNPKLNENVENIVNNYALAVIINDDKQILLLKRNPNIETWQPGKWALVGGGIEEGEEPIDGCKREVKEETGIDINNKINQKFTIQRNPDSTEHVFICKYDGEPNDIKLDFENIAYGWFLPDEIKFLDHVPNLMDYINLAFKKYDD